MIMEFYMPEDEDPAKLRSLQPVTEEQQEQFEEAAQRGYEEAAEVIPVCLTPLGTLMSLSMI